MSFISKTLHTPQPTSIYLLNGSQILMNLYQALIKREVFSQVSLEETLFCHKGFLLIQIILLHSSVFYQLCCQFILISIFIVQLLNVKFRFHPLYTISLVCIYSSHVVSVLPQVGSNILFSIINIKLKSNKFKR